MRWSQLFVPTLRETPSDAEAASHRLLLRAGFARSAGPGLYSYLALGQRSLRKIQEIARQELAAAGGQEILLPGTGSGAGAAKSLAGELRSYKQLPQLWFQFRPAVALEPRPKPAPHRARQYVTLEAYAFSRDTQGGPGETLRRVLARCGVEILPEEDRFAAVCGCGDERSVYCPASGYASPLALAVSRPRPAGIPDPEGDGPPEPFATPDRKTIAEVAEFTGLPETSQMKSLVMVAGGKPVLAMLRGDHSLSEAKLRAVLGAREIRAAHAFEIEEWFGAAPGSLGPVGVTNMPVLADLALQGRKNMISGANRDGYHLRHVTPGRDFSPAWHDLRLALPGDTDARTGEPLEFVQTLELGRLVRLEEAAAVLDESGRETRVPMIVATLGIERILCAAIEASHDANGMQLPFSIAPFGVTIIPVNASDGALRAAAEGIYAECARMGLDPLLDDRDERPGVKFKDAELMGVPCRVTVGKKLADGKVELQNRRTGENREVPVEDAMEAIRTILL